MSLGTDPRRAMQQRNEERAPRPQTTSAAAFSALNLTETRLSIGDDEVAWLENGMFIGRHIKSVPLYNGPAGASLNATSLIKESYGCKLTYGSFTEPHPVGIFVFEDGSAWMRDFFADGAADTQVAPAGTFSTSPKGTAIKIWQDGPVLFIDDTAGYLSWNGVTLTTIDATKTGRQLAVFEGHVWLLTAPRTITYTAPNSFNDFVAGDGAGSFKITDDAFQGSVQALFSTVEQLWILGPGAIDALGNVATTAGVTTFSITNAVTSLGTIYADSVIGYFRALTFYTGYSIHSLLGVTPQKLSAKLDRLFASLMPLLNFGPRVGLQELNGVTIICFLVQFTDLSTGASRSELLCAHEGKWFLARTPDLAGNRVVDLVTLTIRNAPEVYGVDRAGKVYRIFARPADAPQGTLTVSSKLFDLGQPIMGHSATKVGFDLSAPKGTAIAPITVTLVTEQNTAQTLVRENFNALVDSPVGMRCALYRRNAPIIGQRVGWTFQVPCSYGLTLEAAHLEHAPTGEDGWDVVDPKSSVWDFTGAQGTAFRFTGSGGTAFDWLGSPTG